jgi:hypothetical protein
MESQHFHTFTRDEIQRFIRVGPQVAVNHIVVAPFRSQGSPLRDISLGEKAEKFLESRVKPNFGRS